MPTTIRDQLGGGGGGGGTFAELQAADPAWPDTIDEYGITDAVIEPGDAPGAGYVLESNGAGGYAWVLKPADGIDGTSAPEVIVQYSQFDTVPGDFSTIYQPGDIYIIISTDGGSTFSSPSRILGEQGDPGPSGNYTKFIFQNSFNEPSPNPPTGSDPTNGNTGPWYDTPQGGGGFEWMSFATFDGDNNILTTWSLVVRLTGNTLDVEYSANGIDGWNATFIPGTHLYMRQSTDDGATWSDSIRIVGETGADGPFVDYIFARNISAPNTPTGDDPTNGNTGPVWFDAPPSGSATLWMSKAKKDADGTLSQGETWSAPTKLSADIILVEYSPNSTGPWDDVFTAGVDIYLRQSTDGGSTWSNSVKIVGEDGQEGEYTSFIFRRSDSGQPTTPSGNDPTNGNTGPWYDAPPDVLVQAGKLYMSSGIFNGAILQGSWTEPVQLEGEDGAPGDNAKVISLSASGQTFSYDNSTGTPGLIGPVQIVFTANRQNITGATTWTVYDENNSVQSSILTSVTDNSATMTAANFATITNNKYVKVRASVESGSIIDEITIAELLSGADGSDGNPGDAGADAYSVFLTNESHTVQADEFGNNFSLAGASGTFKIFKGLTDVTESASFSIVGLATKNNLTITISNTGGTRGDYSVSGSSWDSVGETFNLRATYDGIDFDKTFTINKSVAGSTGPSSQSIRLTSNSSIFGYDNSSGTPVLQTAPTITFTCSRQNLPSSTTWTMVDDGDVTIPNDTGNGLSTTGDTATLTATQFSNLNTDFVKVTASADGLSDEITIVRLLSGIDGEGSYVGYLTNESHVVAADGTGTIYNLTSAAGDFKIFFGLTDETANSTFQVVAPATKNGLTMAIAADGSYSLSGASWTSDAETFILRATTPGSTTIDKVFSVTKTLAGADGNTSKIAKLVASSQTFSYDNSTGSQVLIGPSQIDFSVVTQNTTGSTSWLLTDSQGVNQTAQLSSVTDSSAILTASNFANITDNSFVKLEIVVDSISDEITIVELISGQDGSDGNPGDPGDPGTDATVGYLTNESHVVAADPNGNNFSLTGADGFFKVYKGITDITEQCTFSVVAPATVDSLVMAISNSAGTKGDYSLSGAWTGTTATFTLRAVTPDAITIDKIYTISKSIEGDKGDQGDPGTPGDPGSDGNVQVFRYYEAAAPVVDDPTALIPLNSGVPWLANPPSSPSLPVWLISSEQNFNKTTLISNWTTPVQLNVDYADTRIANDQLTATNLLDAAGWVTLPENGATADTWGTISGYPGDNEVLNLNQLWAEVSGAGRPADNADVTGDNISAGFTDQANYDRLEMVVTADASDTIIVSGNVISRTVGSGWDAHAWSRDPVIGPFTFAFKAEQNNLYLMAGVNQDPATNASFTSIDYAWYCHLDGTARIYENGTNIGNFGAYTTDTIFMIVFDGEDVKYYKDGTLERTVAFTDANPNTIPFYVDCSINSLNAAWKLLQWSSGPTMIAGADYTNSNISLSSAGALQGAGGGVLALADIAGAVTSTQIATAAITSTKLATNAVAAASIQTGAVLEAKLAANAVTTAKIADNAITSAQIATAAVTATEIGAGAVTTAKIANDAITTDLIAAGAITTTEIGTDAITTAKIAANAITASEIAAGAVTASEIAANTITAGEIAAGAITASEIAAGTITAGEIAAGTITATELAANSVTASEIAANAVTASEIAAGAVTASEIAANTITSAEIAAGAVTASEIAANTIGAGQIAAGAITADELAANAVTAGKIQADAVTAEKIAANAVVAEAILAGAIVAGKIAANAVSATEIIAGTITSNEIATGTITATNIASGTITATEIAAGTITASELAANSVTASQIAANAVTASEIAAGTITATEIATNAIQATSLSAFAANLGTVTGGTFQTATSGKRCVISDTADNIFTIYNASDIPTFYINEAGDLTFSGRLSPNTLTSTEAFSQALLEQLNPAFKASSSTGGSFSLSNQVLTTAITTNQTFDITGTILSGNGNDPVVTLTVTDAGQKAWNDTVTAPSYTLTIQKRTSQTPGSTSYGSWGNIGTSTRTGYANAGSQIIEDGFTFEIPARFGINTTLTVNDTVIDGFNVQYRVIVKYNSGDQNAPLISDATADEAYISGLWNTTISTTDPVDGVDIPDDIGHVWYVY